MNIALFNQSSNPAFSGSEYEETTSSRFLTINYPAGAEAGNLAILWSSVGGGTGLVPVSGYNTILQNNNTPEVHIYTRVLDGTEGVDLSFDSGGPTIQSLALMVYKNANAFQLGSFKDVFDTATQFGEPSMLTLALGPLLGFYSAGTIDASDPWTTVPSMTTRVLEFNNNSQMYIGSIPIQPVGPTGILEPTHATAVASQTKAVLGSVTSIEKVVGLTKFLHNFEGGDESTAISLDETGQIGVGSSDQPPALLSNVDPKFGISSLRHPGTGAVPVLITSRDTILTLNGDIEFCLEFFFKREKTGVLTDLVSLNTSANKGIDISIPANAGDSSVDTVLTDDNLITITSTTTTPIVIGTWYHFACVRQVNDLKGYIDGVLQDTDALPTLLYGNDFNIVIKTGASGSQASIDSMRLVTGDPVYTAPFTPPSSALGIYTT